MNSNLCLLLGILADANRMAKDSEGNAGLGGKIYIRKSRNRGKKTEQGTRIEKRRKPQI